MVVNSEIENHIEDPWTKWHPKEISLDKMGLATFFRDCLFSGHQEGVKNKIHGHNPPAPFQKWRKIPAFARTNLQNGAGSSSGRGLKEELNKPGSPLPGPPDFSSFIGLCKKLFLAIIHRPVGFHQWVPRARLKTVPLPLNQGSRGAVSLYRGQPSPMDLLIRPSLFSTERALLEIEKLLAGSGLSFALFLSRDHIILANPDFVKRWNLVRARFPRYSLSDYANQNALSLSGETRGQFWNWISEPSSRPSQIELPDPDSGLRRFIIRVPTEKDTAEDPLFLEKIAENLQESERERLILLGRRLRNPSRTIIRTVSDELLLEHFFRDELSGEPEYEMAQVFLAKEAVWSPSSGFWRIRTSPGGPKKRISEALSVEESGSILPFRRILFAKNTGGGYWADFPLLFNQAFFGKVRLFRPESRKRELPGLSSFQPKAQSLSRRLFEIRKNLGYLNSAAREPESGFLDRREALLLIEALIEEQRITGLGFGLVGIRVNIPNHKSLMIKVRSILRFYDEIAHMTPREYLLILPAMNPDSAASVIERVRDILLGMNRDQAPQVTFGWLSYPETGKGPMNLVRSVFTREESQPLQNNRSTE